MKRVLLSAIIIFLTSATFAQFTLGPKAGLTMSKLKTNVTDFKEEVKTGYQFGAFVRFGKKIYIQPEVMFATKGGIIIDDSLSYSTKATVDLKTLQIPLLVGYTLINMKVVNVRIMTGPAISFVTSKEITVNANNLLDEFDGKNIKDAIWSWQLGAGVDVFMFTLDVRYEWGMNNIWDASAGEVNDMKQNLWNVSLGWKIL